MFSPFHDYLVPHSGFQAHGVKQTRYQTKLSFTSSILKSFSNHLFLNLIIRCRRCFKEYSEHKKEGDDSSQKEASSSSSSSPRMRAKENTNEASGSEEKSGEIIV